MGFEPTVRVFHAHSLSRRAPSTDSAISPSLRTYPPQNHSEELARRRYLPLRCSIVKRLLPWMRRKPYSIPEPSYTVAEGVGFEPTVPLPQDNGFQDRRLKPLGHPSSPYSLFFLSLRSFPCQVSTPSASSTTRWREDTLESAAHRINPSIPIALHPSILTAFIEEVLRGFAGKNPPPKDSQGFQHPWNIGRYIANQIL